MPISDMFLKEFDGEVTPTRRLLERVPMDHLDWKPHEKSRSLGELSTHVTETIRWGIRFGKAEFLVGSEKAPEMRTREALLDRFDRNVSESRAAIAATTDEQMTQPFIVRRPNGEVFFELSRRSVLRRLLLNHLIHHRGQLTVYLRLQDVPLPSVYGPTADESL
jgi:uncharacterized damage-inducible protein DinB